MVEYKKPQNISATLGDLADVDRTVESLKMEVSFLSGLPIILPVPSHINAKF